MEMKELGRSTGDDTHNITLLICTLQKCLRHLADGRSLHGGRVENTHTHTHTNTHTQALKEVRYMSAEG